ncbi:MAG: hypothetical protein KC455_08965 [Carnobacterium sp.]|nr:hypothetical protein [Carnobacterium sp.]
MAKVLFWKEAEKDYKKLEGILKQWLDTAEKRRKNISEIEIKNFYKITFKRGIRLFLAVTSLFQYLFLYNFMY